MSDVPTTDVSTTDASTTNARTEAAAHEKAKSAFGMVPNLIKEMSAHNPTVAHAYLDASATMGEGVLSAKEEQVVILAISAYNDCHYCTKAHGAAGQAAGLSQETVDTLISGGLPENDRYRALVQASRRILGKRGWLSDADQEELSGLGLGRDVLYEIVGLVGVKTISNYVNHIAHTDIDAAFK